MVKAVVIGEVIGSSEFPLVGQLTEQFPGGDTWTGPLWPMSERLVVHEVLTKTD